MERELTTTITTPPNGEVVGEIRRRTVKQEKRPCKEDDRCLKRLFRMIVIGNGRQIAERILGINPPAWALERLAACTECSQRTYLSYRKWLWFVIRKKALPVNHNPRRGEKMFCTICKCKIEAAIRVREKGCRMGKWKE